MEQVKKQKVAEETREVVLQELRHFQESEAMKLLRENYRNRLLTKAKALRALLRQCGNANEVYAQGAFLDGFEEGFGMIDELKEKLKLKETKGPDKPLY